MRTYTRFLFSLLAAISLPVALWANVIVKGTVKNGGGQPAVSYPVQIATDSLNSSGCIINHTVYTNSTGNYSDTLKCSSTIAKVFVTIVNCDNTPIHHELQVVNNQPVESNFVICSRPCSTTVNSRRSDSIPLAVMFSAGNEVSPGDHVEKFYWNFGDGTIDSLHMYVMHTFHNAGIYNVCFSIRTAWGCTSQNCKQINSDSPHLCHAEFNFERIQSAVNKFKFNSSQSFAGTNDNIVSRKWSFGDGDSLSGNVIDPEHQYAHSGYYVICLTTTSASGCVSNICKGVQVGNNDCHPEFTTEQLAGSVTLIKFNSTSSTVIAGDSIIGRTWTFGDGATLTGNVVAPQHQYANGGSYTVCLTTLTRLGCEKTVCKPIVIGQVGCHADFTQELLSPTPNTGRYVKFHSNSSTTGSQDSIVSRRWKFGDGTSLDGNVVDPTHFYLQPGTYTVCLVIKSSRGCSDSVCKPVVIPTTSIVCHADWNHEIIPPTATNGSTSVRFHSQQSTTSASDSIVSRRWTFGDGTGITAGNVVDPIHVYAQPGTYTVCLYITSGHGCKDSVCKPVVVPANTFHCQPRFTSFATGLSVKFNSAPTTIAAGDSIVNRFWTFGDGSTAGNLKDPTHAYPRAGVYEVCLRIQTRLGCMETWCKKVAVVTAVGNCVPYFTAEQINGVLRTMRFNSEPAYSQLAGDSIVERNWIFGDGSTLGGNVINPTHQYAARGSFTVCLKLRTAAGCDTRWCREVVVQGTDSTHGAVLIVNLYPVPVNTTLNATLWSLYNNVNSELSIYDVYGVKKWSQNKLLPGGNSTTQIPVSQLANGPYIFRVTTIYGVVSRNFFKVQ
ncbi:MAG: PKD domain-containing protein [Chitinophagaceae bacterium]